MKEAANRGGLNSHMILARLTRRRVGPHMRRTKISEYPSDEPYADSQQGEAERVQPPIRHFLSGSDVDQQHGGHRQQQKPPGMLMSQ